MGENTRPAVSHSFHLHANEMDELTIRYTARATREIAYYQRAVGRMLPFAPFMRLVREMAVDIVQPENKESMR